MTADASAAEKTILVADDDAAVTMSITGYLQSLGYRTMAAADGEEAMKAITEGRPDLAILDIDMPKGSGIVLTRELRAHTDRALRAIPVIILTVETNKSLRREMLSLGANAFLTKPVHWPELFAEMGRCVQLPKKVLEDFHLEEQLTISQLQS